MCLGMNRTLLFASTSLALFASACGAPRPSAPSGPSDDITLAEAPTDPITTTTVRCTGPDAEVAALGALCSESARLSAYHHIADPLSAITRIMATSDSGPYLLVVGFAPTGTPDDGQLRDWDASGVRHSAFLVRQDRSVDVVSSLEAYEEGEPLTGELVTTAFNNGACSVAWRGAGSLHVGEVTITLTWTSTAPC
jgi:hypothetical protein